jgi:glucose-fructose oxidoreductase
MKTWKIAGINFDHFHMGDLLRMAHEHPAAEIVAICDEQPERMVEASRNFGIPADRVFTDYRACMERTKPDLVILCPAAAKHGEWVERVAPFGVHLIVEKPFAASLGEADRMVVAQRATGKQLAINWPLRWVESHVTAKRLVDEGLIGELIEFHHFGGNRGPLWHTADKIERTAADVTREKPKSWFYKREHGGGSLLDYAGYGSTLGTWFMNGRKPVEVTAIVDQPAGLEVDEHSLIVCRYQSGLSKIETRWGTFTDPWTHQTQPFCGFTLVGTDGTISSADYAPVVHVQTRKRPEVHEVPADPLTSPGQNPVQYMLDCLERGRPIEGPLSVEIARIGQQIVDSAVRSVAERRPVPLVG